MIFFGAIITLIQLGGAYLRYLPFRRELSEREVARLRKRLLLWSVAAFALNVFIAADGVTYRAYKLALLPGWIPYFLLSLTVIRNKLPQNIFVLGMQCLWSFTLHAFAGMGVALIFGAMSEEFLLEELSLYTLLLVALLKVEIKFFVNLLPTPKFFEDRALKWYVSLLPFAIFIGATISIAEVTFLPAWQEKFSRLAFPIFFMLMYRALSISTHNVTEIQRQERRTRLLRQQTDSLAEHNALIRKSRREVADLQEKLSGNYKIIDSLLAEGKISDAMDFIRRQGNLLDATRVETFCDAPLVNAAISMHFRRAEEIGIKIRHKIDLPAQFATDESDLAVLLSNLLENAINASKRQPFDARELSLIIRHGGSQYVLEISNRYDFPIKIGDNGLPYTAAIGHGFGMASLELFAKKYDAFFDFAHEDNFACLSLYWNDDINGARNIA